MKTLLISLGIILFAFLALQIFAIKVQYNIETYPYKIISEYDEFEIRNYEATLFTSVKLPSSKYEDASSKGFRILAGYIFGKNQKEEKISMTSPVSMSLEDSMTMMFMVPKKIKKEELPKPDESEIEFKEVPAKKMAAISFGGWADNKKIEKYKLKLIGYLDDNNIPYSNRFYFFGYNSPYEFFFRKNEVIVELKQKND